MFSDILLSQPLIKDKFNEALDIMNRAVSTGMGWYNSQSILSKLLLCKIMIIQPFFVCCTKTYCNTHSFSYPQVDICNPVQERILHI